MYRIISTCFMAIIACQMLVLHAYAESDYSVRTFEKLGIQLSEKITTEYYAGDSVLIQGRVTNKKEYAFFYLQNINTKEELTELVHTDANGYFRIPVALPKIA